MQLAQLNQELVDLPGDLRVLEAIEAVAKYVRLGKLELTASSVLERLGFPASRQWTPVGAALRRRAAAAAADPAAHGRAERAAARRADERPGRRHARRASRTCSTAWPGTLVVVSHDRYLVERVCDTVVALFGDGRITHLPGGIDEYLRAARGSRRRPGRVDRVRGAPGGATPPDVGSSAAEQRAARKDAARLERRLETLSAREEKLHAQLAEAATDPDRLLALDADLRAVVAEREQVELDWLAAAELAES